MLNKATGFTLLELITAISLSVVLMTVLSGGFYQITQRWEQHGAILDQEIDNSMIINELDKAFASAYPYAYRDKKKVQKVFFDADIDHISFISTFSPSYTERSMLWILRIKSDGGLGVQVVPALSGDPQKLIKHLEQEETIIFSDYQISWKFLYQHKDVSDWKKQWDAKERNALPKAVQLELVSKEQEDDPAIKIIFPVFATNHPIIKEKTDG